MAMNRTRRIGLLKVAGGVVGAFVVWLMTAKFPKLRFFAVLLLMFAFFGLLELASGFSTHELEKKWDALPAGRKFLIGLVSAACVIGGIILCTKIMM
jgi:uncharacterized membrane protein YfcA